jgi:predicted nucleotide-binding protein
VRQVRHHESRVNKARIFLGSSGKQAKLLQAITRGLEDVADVEPWTTTFNPGRSTLDRLVELSQEVDFAAFVFAQDDWTTTDASQSGQASPRDNVVFEAGLFGGALGIRRTFILHAHGSNTTLSRGDASPDWVASVVVQSSWANTKAAKSTSWELSLIHI